MIFSTKGSRSALSWLGGGDYDGDTVILVWEPELVGPFANAPACRGDPPAGFVEANFKTTETRTTEEYATALARLDHEMQELELQGALLNNIGGSSTVGQYSNL